MIIVSPTTSSDCGPGPFELKACTMTAYLVPLLRSVIFTSSIAGPCERSSSELEDVGKESEFELGPERSEEDADDADEGLGESESTVMVLKI